MSSPPQLSLSYINALNVGKRSRAAALGLLFYDQIINLDREIYLVWMRDKKRPAFWLYTFNRFFVLGYYIFDTIPITPAGATPSKMCAPKPINVWRLRMTNGCLRCAIYLMCDGIVTTLSTLIVQIVLQLRIYALYERNRNIMIFLLVLCSLEIAVMAVLVGVTMGHLEGLPILSAATGCAYQGLLKLSTLIWIPGLIFEPVLFILVAYKAWSPVKNHPTIPLVQKIARDSLLYFAAVFVELLVSTIIWMRYPKYINIMNPWSAALPSILGSRLMLNMREAVYRNGDPDSYIMETFATTSTHISYRASSRSVWDDELETVED